ncbi:hypothetical protein CAEBREN_19768 [Caenorhabditis brenneri]|uniref:Uncharacterized protein n=1 Tax=Caenorhabditis brenneri TaxID=135651 RepID=G0N494_CAEBE|nr:hypothetical protein CAEBREN_19768 [Caenorhabditis brenneri]
MTRQNKKYEKPSHKKKTTRPREEPEVQWTFGYIVGRWLNHTFIVFHLFLLMMFIAEVFCALFPKKK